MNKGPGRSSAALLQPTNGKIMKASLLLTLIGKNIRHKRKEAKLTIRGLAAICGLSKTQISYMENGQHAFTIVSLSKVANGLECEVGDLMP
jgi:DNA-binding Xre family transcriptional regulator